jgi:DNA-binding transcriptional MerR regulator
MKRRGNRRYYQHHEVLLVRRIRELLYEQGFTISGARNRLGEAMQAGRRKESVLAAAPAPVEAPLDGVAVAPPPDGLEGLRADLQAVLDLLRIDGAPPAGGS